MRMVLQILPVIGDCKAVKVGSQPSIISWMFLVKLSGLPVAWWCMNITITYQWECDSGEFCCSACREMDANHQSVSYLLDHFQDPGMEEDPLMSISCLFYLKTALENSPKSVEKSCFGGKILSVLLQILRKDFHSSDRTKEVHFLT